MDIDIIDQELKKLQQSQKKACRQRQQKKSASSAKPFPKLSKTQTAGLNAQLMAKEFLEKQGLSMWAENIRIHHDEIDLIMLSPCGTLIFVEVRMRNNLYYGTATESIIASKQRKMLRAAQLFIQRYHIQQPCRIDVVGITGGQIEWIQHALMDKFI